MYAPSIKTLNQHFSPDHSEQIRGLIKRKIDPENYESVQRWLKQCYNRPSEDSLVMCAIDEILGGFGVEAIRGRYIDAYHYDIQACYVNQGDTYDTTILLDHEQDRYIVTSYGDWIERNGRKREIV